MILYIKPAFPIAQFDCPAMSEDEKLIAAALVLTALKAGMTVSVNDGEETTVTSHNMDDLMAALGSTGEDRLLLNKEGQRHGWIWLIYGNSPSELVSDYIDIQPVRDIVEAVAGLNVERDFTAYDDDEFAVKCAKDILITAGIHLS